MTYMQLFLSTPLFTESLVNSMIVGIVSVITTSLIGVPLAYLLTRYEFKTKTVMEMLSSLPLIMPPFIGTIGLTYFFGRSGTINLFLLNFFHAEPIPFLEGIGGVIFVETLHLYPLILLNCSASLANIDPALEEAAENLGASEWNRFKTVTFPLMLPGYAAGALLVFLWSLSDLGTPLVIGSSAYRLLAPQAFLRITAGDMFDPFGNLACVFMVALSLIALLAVRKYVGLRQYAVVPSGVPQSAIVKRLEGKRLIAISLPFIVLIFASLLPHIGIILSSFATVWSFSYLPQGYTLNNYYEITFRTPQFLTNTLLYCSLSAALDIVLGAAIAYMLVRKRFPGHDSLDTLATMPFAIPGVVLGIGYLSLFHNVYLPGMTIPLTRTIILVILSYAVRRLPYTIRSCHASLQQIHVSLEEASKNLGANGLQTFMRITLPLMMGGLVAGGLLAFVNAVVEISTTLLLIPSTEYGPLSFGIYDYIHTPVGYGSACALGVIAISMVAITIVVVNRVFGKRMGTLFRA